MPESPDYERAVDRTLYCRECKVELGCGHQGWGPPPVRLGPPYCSVGTAARIRALEVANEGPRDA